jgi:uncharacterized protein (TIGR02145 family)
MKKSNLLLVFYITIFQIGITTYAQKVSNITFRQEQSNIIVTYDLETKTPCKVSLYVSTNGGTTWQGPLCKVTGDVGKKIVSGNNNIAWNVLEEFDELKGDNIKFQVKAIISDIDTIKIGTQEWTTKNLNVSTYRNGDIIPEVKDSGEWLKLTTGAWCYYDNDPKNGEIFGKLYNWYAVNDPRGLAPEGFHIPSDSEWDKLIDYLGGYEVAGGKMKEIGSKNLNEPNIGALNNISFNGFLGGFRYVKATFQNIRNEGDWWSLSQWDSSSESVSHRRMTSYSNSISTQYVEKTYGCSVRCLRD